MRSAFIVMFLFVTSAIASAQSTATERIVLVVEVTDRDPSPVTPCGIHGAQPRAVDARVIAVESGTFDEPTIHLTWPMCEFSGVDPGTRFRIRIVRRVGVTPPGATYRVRSSTRVSAQ